MGSLIGLKNIVIFSAVLLTIGSVSAQQAFAGEGEGTLYATEPHRCELWTIDPSNGDSKKKGNTADGDQLVPLPSLAVHPTSGVMYAGGGGDNTGCDDPVTIPSNPREYALVVGLRASAPSGHTATQSPQFMQLRS